LNKDHTSELWSYNIHTTFTY